MAESSGTNLGKAWVQIAPSAQGIAGAIRRQISGEASAAGESAGGMIADGIKAAIAAAGIGITIKKAFEEGAALQQSIGGIETLFKDSAGTVREYAAQAYETAGLSANEYMENVTGFAASLLQGLGGDTAQAAEIANMAMVDMADNANKMGTDMSSIQNAYQGFAKQNYTMLDNLKLGYGGTQAEMARLINDAKVLGEEITVDEKSVKNVPFDKIIEAIHTIQTGLDISGISAKEAAELVSQGLATEEEAFEMLGTTAKEASSTFTGSFAAMQSAAKNVLGNIAIGEDVAPALNGLAETTSTWFFQNFIPMLGNIVTALPGAIGTFITAAAPDFIAQGGELLQNIYNGVMEGIPKVTEAGVEIIQKLAAGVAEGIPRLAETALPAIVDLTGNLRENAGKLADAGIDLLKNLAKGFADSIPTLIENIPTIISNIAGIINDNAPKILAAGVQIIVTLIAGIIKAIPTLIAEAPKIVKAVFDVVTAANWLNLGKNIVNGITNGIKSIRQNIGNAVQDTVKSANDVIMNWKWGELIRTVGQTIHNTISGLGGGLWQAVKTVAQTIANNFKNFNWAQLGNDIVNGIIKGVTGKIGDAVGAAKTLATSIFGGAQVALDAHSPSRLFEWLGETVPAGLAEGIMENLNPVKAAVDELMDATYRTPAQLAYAGGYAGYTGGELATGGGSGQDADVYAIAEIFAAALVAAFEKLGITINIGNSEIKNFIVQAIKEYNLITGGRAR